MQYFPFSSLDVSILWVNFIKFNGNCMPWKYINYANFALWMAKSSTCIQGHRLTSYMLTISNVYLVVLLCKWIWVNRDFSALFVSHTHTHTLTSGRQFPSVYFANSSKISVHSDTPTHLMSFWCGTPLSFPHKRSTKLYRFPRNHSHPTLSQQPSGHITFAVRESWQGWNGSPTFMQTHICEWFSAKLRAALFNLC